MAKAICVQCSQEFPSDDVFQEHKKSGHVTQGRPLVPPGQDVDPELLQQIQRIEEKKKDPEPEVPQKVELPPPTPITLSYRYTGQCPTCRREVVTFPMDVKIKDVECHVVIAYCENCKTQLQSREEKKL